MSKVQLPTKRARTVHTHLPPGITRVNQPSTRTFGFVARAGHRQTKKGWRPKFTAYFGDHTWGGEVHALAAANRWMKGLARTGKAPVIKKPAKRKVAA